MKIYRVLNPTDGSYLDAGTLEQATDIMIQTAWDFFLHHTHGNPVSLVEILDNGNERWQNLDGTEQQTVSNKMISNRSLPLSILGAEDE